MAKSTSIDVDFGFRISIKKLTCAQPSSRPGESQRLNQGHGQAGLSPKSMSINIDWGFDEISTYQSQRIARIDLYTLSFGLRVSVESSQT